MGGSSVFFGGTAVTITGDTATQITLTSPAGTANTSAQVTVTTVGGTTDAVSFAYPCPLQ